MTREEIIATLAKTNKELADKFAKVTESKLETDEPVTAAISIREVKNDARFFLKELTAASKELEKAFKALYNATIKIDSCRYIREVGPIADKMHDITESFDSSMVSSLEKIIKYLTKVDEIFTAEEEKKMAEQMAEEERRRKELGLPPESEKPIEDDEEIVQSKKKTVKKDKM